MVAAEALGAEVISCDARQIYRGLEIGSAQPSPAQRARVVHHCVATAEPLTHFTAADYGRQARGVLAELATRGVPPMVVGGSGLYLRALVDGLADVPGRDPELRRVLEARARRDGARVLHTELAGVDPEAAARLHPHDTVRVVRALEVAQLTGRALSEHHRRRPAESLAARTRIVVLDRPREALAARIAERARRMFENGLLDEAQALLEKGLNTSHAVYRTVGYAQAFQVLQGEMTRESAIDATERATRRYAKRQRTWFRGLAGAVWVAASNEQTPVEIAERVMAGWRQPPAP